MTVSDEGPVVWGASDRTGAAVTIRLEETLPIGSYVVGFDDEPPVGRADFVDRPGTPVERIFFRTEVDEEFGGRGLAGLLLRTALADSIRRGVAVVPVCPLFAGHLKTHGEEFVADGGVLRRPTRDDLALVARATQAGR